LTYPSALPDATAPAAAAPRPAWRCGTRSIDLGTPRVMGIVNVTPDSFSDGGRYLVAEAAIEHGRRLAAEGAEILDIGGESTRPGAVPVDPGIEIERVLPVIEGLRPLDVALSIDSRHAEVIRAAIRAGADIVNDVSALREPGALEACAAAGVGVCLMHMRGDPATMQIDPTYADVVSEVREFLRERVARCMAAGIDETRIVVDPGFGFGKTLAHNLALLRGLGNLAVGLPPLLVGLSRKSVLGAITGKTVEDRTHASVAAALLAVARGARVVRVHDVRATRNALAVWNAVEDHHG
jgi:dihydropteroate synthase